MIDILIVHHFRPVHIGITLYVGEYWMIAHAICFKQELLKTDWLTKGRQLKQEIIISKSEQLLLCYHIKKVVIEIIFCGGFYLHINVPGFKFFLKRSQSIQNYLCIIIVRTRH